MLELFRMIISIPPPFNMVVLIIVVIFGAVTLMEFAKQIRLFISHRQELDLKRELVDRGMTAEEIERVMRASQSVDRGNDAEVS